MDDIEEVVTILPFSSSSSFSVVAGEDDDALC
jgi:hypothetical protein